MAVLFLDGFEPADAPLHKCPVCCEEFRYEDITDFVGASGKHDLPQHFGYCSWKCLKKDSPELSHWKPPKTK